MEMCVGLQLSPNRPVVEERLQEMTTRWQYVPSVTNGMSRVINRKNSIDVFP